jgi:hypothetical protein
MRSLEPLELDDKNKVVKLHFAKNGVENAIPLTNQRLANAKSDYLIATPHIKRPQLVTTVGSVQNFRSSNRLKRPIPRQLFANDSYAYSGVNHNILKDSFDIEKNGWSLPSHKSLSLHKI